MLNNLRRRIAPAMERIGRRAAASGISPMAWTLIGLACAAASAALFGTGAWPAVALGGAVLLASGFFDMIDGQVARTTKSESRRGAFFDSVSDKIGESAVFVGILVGGLASPYLVITAALLSLLVSYARSRAESLGVPLEGVGIGERAERLLIVAVAAIVGGLGSVHSALEFAMIAVCIIAGITLVQRIARVMGELGARERRGGQDA